MKTSNRLFKFLDVIFGGMAIIILWIIVVPLLKLKRKPKGEPRKVLFSKFCCQGDALLSLFALRDFREKYPNTQMIALTSSKTEEVFRESGIFDKYMKLNISGQAGIGEMFKSNAGLLYLRIIFLKGIDVYVDMDLYYRFSTLAGLLVLAKQRLGFATSGLRSMAFSKRIQRERKKHEVECYYDLLAPLGVKPSNRRPIVFPFLALDQENAKKALRDKGWNGSDRIVGLLPGSSGSWPEKRWPISKFQELMQMMIEKKNNIKFVILGQKEEADLGRYLSGKYPELTINMMGQTDFKRLVSIVNLCSIFIGNDSGPMHIADLLGIPCVGIFGPTDERKWSPRGNHSSVVTDDQCDCRPCYFLSSMPVCTHLRCLKNISAASVLAVSQSLIRGRTS